MDPIQALLGMASPDDPNTPQNMQAMAESLRGQKNLGDFLGVSGISQISDAGKGMSKDATNMAKANSDNQYRLTQAMERKQQQDLTNSRNAVVDGRATTTFEQGQQDRLLSQALAKEQRGRDRQTTEGNVRMQDEDGKHYIIGMNELGQPVDINNGQRVDTSKLRPVLTEDQQLKRDKLGAGQASEAAEVEKTYFEAMSKEEEGLNLILTAGDNGSLTGKLAEKFPTLRDSTSLYETGREMLTLIDAPKHKLAPMSDSDIRMIRTGSVPSLGSANTKGWALHRLEVNRRVNEATAMYDNAMKRNGGRPLSQRQEEALNARKEEILYGTDTAGQKFNFAYDIAASERGEYNQYDRRPKTSTSANGDGGGRSRAALKAREAQQEQALKRQADEVTAAANKLEYDKMTPADQAIADEYGL